MSENLSNPGTFVEPVFGRLLTAMVTPFAKDGSVDEKQVADLANYLVENGHDGLVVCGTTGEYSTMTDDENERVFQIVKDTVGSRAKIIAGVGSNDTAHTIELAHRAEKIGVDGLLVVTPYYNKPTQPGVYAHFATVAQAAETPVMLYDIPGRAGIPIAPETYRRLAEIDSIVAVKDAKADFGAATEVMTTTDLHYYSGDDGLIIPFMSVGATGLISVLSNIGGGILQDVMQAYEDGRVREAAKLNARMVPLANAMFIETNPIPVKAAVTLVTGIDAGQPRLPLTPMEPANKAKMVAVLQEYGLVK